MLALLVIFASVWLWQWSVGLAVLLLLLAALLLYFHLPVYMVLKNWIVLRLARPIRSFWQLVLRRLGIPAAALITLNNRTVRLGRTWSSVLVMVSRCLQWSGCQRDVISDLNNCAACGRCKLGAIRSLCNKRGIRVTVEGGGTAARKRLAIVNPDLVVAVACDRELLEGMACTSTPVIGVPLSDPSDCSDNDVDIDIVSAYLRQIKQEG